MAWLLVMVSEARAEPQRIEPFRFDVGGLVSYVEDPKRGGVGMVIELKRVMHPRFAAGVRTDYAMIFGRQVDDAWHDRSWRRGLLAKAEYYAGQGVISLWFGAGLGVFWHGVETRHRSDTTSIAVYGKVLGVALQTGIDFEQPDARYRPRVHDARADRADAPSRASPIESRLAYRDHR